MRKNGAFIYRDNNNIYYYYTIVELCCIIYGIRVLFYYAHLKLYPCLYDLQKKSLSAKKYSKLLYSYKILFVYYNDGKFNDQIIMNYFYLIWSFFFPDSNRNLRKECAVSMVRWFRGTSDERCIYDNYKIKLVNDIHVLCYSHRIITRRPPQRTLCSSRGV